MSRKVIDHEQRSFGTLCLKFRVDRSCFREASTDFGGEVEEERKKKGKEKEENRTQHNWSQQSACLTDTNMAITSYCIEGSYKSSSCCLSVLPTCIQFTLLYLLLGK